jgi:nitrogen fixation/metabolism regulation signal transduction histidine kinase
MAEPGSPQAAAAAPPAKTGRHQRSLKNYLLDPHFQLKYTSYLVAIAVVLSVTLGALLWTSSRDVIAQSRASVTQGLETVRRGQELVKESQKVSTVVKMNIAKEYADQPELAKIFSQKSDEEATRLQGEQKRLEEESKRLGQQAAELEQQQVRVMTTLVAGLTALVLFVALAGIVITHRVAGPIFKMKRQIRELGEGNLRMPGKLRKGDELVHFFETFEETVKNLRRHQEEEIAKIDAIIAENDKETIIGRLQGVRDEMKAALD